MLPKDIDAVYKIEAYCFASPWSKASFTQELENNQCTRYIVAVKDDKVIGYGGIWLIINEAHITNIAVKENYRKKRIGTMILKSLMQIAWEALEIKKMTLEVRNGNHIAQQLYRKYGFMTAGIRKKYYEDNEDAVIMWCNDFTPYLPHSTNS
ncbi:MAG: ribosomal protein S18-alanine N-acetyltransferase [Clostridiales bacterium]|nr:ribosomal protein S18-alanine N-acetyltransferase [Clostridiales bacterium]